MGVPQNGWFIRENAIKMDDSGVTPVETSIWGCTSWLTGEVIHGLVLFGLLSTINPEGLVKLLLG